MKTLLLAFALALPLAGFAQSAEKMANDTKAAADKTASDAKDSTDKAAADTSAAAHKTQKKAKKSAHKAANDTKAAADSMTK